MNTTTTADYVYQRKDGGTTLCYGKVRPESNFEVTCDNEWNDGIFNSDSFRTWKQACEYLEKYYDRQIEQLVAC